MTPASLATAKRRTASSASKTNATALGADPTTVARAETKGGPRGLVLKQVLDYTIASICLLLAAPLFLLIAVLIKLNSRGPVLYEQQRVGKQGNVFRFYKFRTMRHDSDDTVHREFSRSFIRGEKTGDNGNGNRHADENGNGHAEGNGNGDGNNNGNGCRPALTADEAETGSVYKLTSDPRVTRVGQFLRRWSLDELPQLLNVLRGDMSLVGPRPPIVYELEHYQDWHKRRLCIKPGITGLWQVSGRSSVPFDAMVELDLHYIEHRSTRMDLWIMARTVPAIVHGEGAY